MLLSERRRAGAREGLRIARSHSDWAVVQREALADDEIANGEMVEVGPSGPFVVVAFVRDIFA